MSTRRVIHERDAYKRDACQQVARAYAFEGDVFWDCFPPVTKKNELTKERALELIEEVYAAFAPNRIRPKLRWSRRRKTPGHNGSYNPPTHAIWLPAGHCDENILLHELAHSLTWKPSWTGHGEYFLRMLIELHCWYLRIPVTQVVAIAQEEHDMDVADAMRIGDDPTKVTWIRRKR